MTKEELMKKLEEMNPGYHFENPDKNFIEEILDYLEDYMFDFKQVVTFIQMFDISTKREFIEVTDLGIKEIGMLTRTFIKKNLIKAWEKSDEDYQIFFDELTEIMESKVDNTN